MTEQFHRQEVGYALLEECQVLVPATAVRDGMRLASTSTTSDVDCSAASSASPFWYNVDLQPAVSIEGKGLPEIPDNYGRDLVLQPCCVSRDEKSTGNVLSWKSATEIIPFNGLLSEITIDSSSLNSDSSASPKRRSDASLLAGLAIEINTQADQFQQQLSELGGDDSLHLRHLRMESVKIMFWEDVSHNNKRESDTDEKPCRGLLRMKASLLVTFSLPLHQHSNNPNDIPLGENQNHLQKKKSKSKSSVKTKMLSSGHQLIGSIIRCDWSHLDTKMEQIQQKARSDRNTMDLSDEHHDHTTSGKPFFPDLLNVEELYDRISGASKHFNHVEKEHNTKSRASHRLCDSEPLVCANSDTKMEACSSKPVGFMDIPEDLIATSIAPYLRAQSLHALRVCNRKMHRSLRAVVPGLKLKLFHHQIRSLEWMEMRERRCTTEDDVLCRNENTSFSSNNFLHEGEAVCGGDLHRAVTGGATVLLSPRPNGHVHGTLRFDSESGSKFSSDCETQACAPLRKTRASPDGETQRKTRCARGGLLCDDPGLGKTITVISLILRSFGLSTKAAVEADEAGSDESLFYSYWYSSFLTDHVRKPALLKLITRLINSDRASEWFVPPIDEFLDQVPDYMEVIKTPICFQDIRNKYNKSDCRDFKEFEAEIRLCFSNAMTYYPPHHDVYRAAERLSKNFDELLNEFKSENINTAAKSITRMAKDPSARSLVDAFEARKRAELQEPLVPSSSTLLVVPNSLLSHWEEQMILHIDFSYISRNGSHSPPIYYHTSKRNIHKSDANKSFDLTNIADPLIFIDDGSRALPPPSVLARFPIVLTSYNRFTAEWKNGSVEQEIRASKKGGIYWGDDAPAASPLLKVSWLRVIVDEGHAMGKSTNNLIQFASWLAAQRTWAMTGTPTQQVATQNGLRNLYYLANFLKHEYFNKFLGREKVWNCLIASGWKVGNVASFFRLKHLLSFFMVRHTKADLVEIPPPSYFSACIELSQPETTTYNTIVSAIRTNIITTSMEGKTSGWQDSLLNPRQSRYASEALTNLRVACCGGVQILPQILNKHWAETLDICRKSHNLDDVKVQVVDNFIRRAQAAELSGCHCCGVQLQTLFVIPCGHLVCTECMDNKTISCPICEKSFDVDDFQRLQPGLDNQFCLNLQEEKKEREKQHALKRALADSTGPGRAIEIDEVEEIEANASTNTHAAQRHKRGESCIYSSLHRDGKCKICREEHFDCNFMNSEQQCSVCLKSAEKCPDYASKSKYVINKLLQLRNKDFTDGCSGECNVSPMAARLFAKRGSNHTTHRPLKAIVFSQFRTIYEYFGDRLIRRFGGACVADYSYAGTRSQELQKFIHQPECFVMLLSKQGSVGLDLSFVTHIFFLESIYDKSLEAQVVARAYRMGSTGSVFVEQLTAKDSIEEVMNRLNTGHQASNDVMSDPKEKHAKLHTLLKNAKLIRPTQKHKTKKRKLTTSDDAAQEHIGNSAKRASKAGGVSFKD